MNVIILQTSKRERERVKKGIKHSSNLKTLLIWCEYHKVKKENIMKQIKILCMYKKPPCNKLIIYTVWENSQNWRFTSIPAGV